MGRGDDGLVVGSSLECDICRCDPLSDEYLSENVIRLLLDAYPEVVRWGRGGISMPETSDQHDSDKG